MSYLFTKDPDDPRRWRAQCEQFKARIEKSCGTSFDKIDCEEFADLIRNVDMNYERRLSDEVPDHQPNLHELEPHLSAVIALLNRRANSTRLLTVLNRKTGRLNWGVDPITKRSTRYDSLLRDLRSIRREVPGPPERPGRGRPSGTKYLRAMAEDIAAIWVRMTGSEFTSDWIGKGKGTWKPASPAAQFVYAIVESIDRRHIGSLRKVMEAIVKRGRATSQKGS